MPTKLPYRRPLKEEGNCKGEDSNLDRIKGLPDPLFENKSETWSQWANQKAMFFYKKFEKKREQRFKNCLLKGTVTICKLDHDSCF